MNEPTFGLHSKCCQILDQLNHLHP